MKVHDETSKVQQDDIQKKVYDKPCIGKINLFEDVILTSCNVFPTEPGCTAGGSGPSN